jgi:hypothetical protein
MKPTERNVTVRMAMTTMMPTVERKPPVRKATKWMTVARMSVMLLMTTMMKPEAIMTLMDVINRELMRTAMQTVDVMESLVQILRSPAETRGRKLVLGNHLLSPFSFCVIAI